MSPLARLFGPRLLSGNGGTAVPTLEALQGASAVGLYFSASWCPPCRQFTPLLSQSYESRLHAKGFRCVLISWDKDEKSFASYREHMPWLTLPWEEAERNKLLSKHFQVGGIPTLAIVNSKGRTITTEGREAVMRDPSGSDFPWTPPLVRDLASGNPGKANEGLALLFLCEAAGEAEQKLAEEGLSQLAKTFAGDAEAEFRDWDICEAQAGDSSRPNYEFLVGTGGQLAAQVRKLTGLAPGGPPQLLMLDIPNGTFYVGADGPAAFSEDSARSLLKAFEDGLLQRQRLKLS